MDGAIGGAIFFSLGSNVQSVDLSSQKQSELLQVFSKLKQRVLWKWEGDSLTNKSDNVMIQKWFPQRAILAHPNVKLFISHCGLSSIYEAKYYGVPILAIPIFADQPVNAKVIENEGWSISINLPDLNASSFTEKLHEILSNQMYTEKIKFLSELYKDRPQHPMDTAIYWVEYIIRHNGAKHIQSPAVHLSFIQYHSLDVISLLVIIVYLTYKIIFYLSKKLWKLFFKSKVKKL